MKKDKLTTLKEAASRVPDGAHLSLSGFVVTRTATAFVHELIRQGKGGLTLSQSIAGFDTDLLVGAGAVKRIIYGGGSLDRFGPIFNVNRAIETESLDIREYSGLTIVMKYLAGSLSLPYMPSSSLLGSDVLKVLVERYGEDEVQESVCPFTGRKLVLLRALQPDWTVLHVQRADAQGNAQIDGPSWAAEVQAKAAHHIVIVAEEIVTSRTIQKQPERTIIPAFRVDAVVHQPFGGHPSAVYHYYDYDAEHLQAYVGQARSPETMKGYVEEYVLGVEDFAGYLEKIGGQEKLQSLKADRKLGY